MLGGRRELPLEAETLGAAFASIKAELPGLAVHLFDESGGLREHVNVFHRGRSSRWDDPDAIALADGDEILVLQAVSGG